MVARTRLNITLYLNCVSGLYLHQIEKGINLYAPAVLPPPGRTGQETGWSSEPICTLCKIKTWTPPIEVSYLERTSKFWMENFDIRCLYICDYIEGKDCQSMNFNQDYGNITLYVISILL